jgi:DNA-binding transcriptional ArsR family regulator/predicted nucleotidyltransferase
MTSKNTKKIVLYLLRNLELININQLAVKTNISVGSAFNILKVLEKNNIVISKKLGNAIFYSLNLDSEETIKLAELFLMEELRTLKGYSKIYGEEIGGFKNSELIILFGSVLGNKDFNDIDVLFISDNAKEVSKFCLDLSKIKTKPIVPIVMEKEEIIREIKNKNPAVIDIIRTGIILKGESIFIDILKNAKK